MSRLTIMVAEPFPTIDSYQRSVVERRVRRIRRFSHLLMSVIAFAMAQFHVANATISSRTLSDSSSSSSSFPSFTIRLPGNRYDEDWDEEGINSRSWRGSGREFSIFESRGGSSRSDPDDDGEGGNGSSRRPPSSSSSSSLPPSEEDWRTREMVQRYRRARMGSTRTKPLFRSYDSSSSRSRPKPEIFQTVSTWWSDSVVPNLEKMPKIVCRVEPTTTLKLRKTFRPLKTIIRLGADFNTQLGVWQFQSSWEDAIIGGKLTLAGKELQLTKSWQLSVGAVEDLVTRLRFRAAINLQTFQAYARVGFRTERLSPINVMEGFTILKRLPLDGSRGNVKLEVKANIALPEPELEYSTETQRSLIGNMGDVEVSIDELNLLLDY